jgi:predicted HTH domain antitoxin
MRFENYVYLCAHRRAKVSENQLLEDIAIMLYQKGKLTFGQAAQTAKLSYTEFQFLLGRNKISINYEVEQFLEDIETIKSL